MVSTFSNLSVSSSFELFLISLHNNITLLAPLIDWRSEVLLNVCRRAGLESLHDLNWTIWLDNEKRAKMLAFSSIDSIKRLCCSRLLGFEKKYSTGHLIDFFQKYRSGCLIEIQGVSSGFDIMYLGLTDRNMRLRVGLKVVWES